MSTTDKLIVVLGATGLQGASVVDTFLEIPGWKVRGVTRNPDGAKGRALAARGVEVVKADLNDAASLTAAFTGAHAIFAVTDFWAPFFDPATEAKLAPGQLMNEYCFDEEVRQAKNIFHAVIPVLDGLERFVYSTLPGIRKWSKGKYTWAYHFDSKQAAVDYLEEKLPELAAKTSYVNLGLYVTNERLMAPLKPTKIGDGIYQLARVASSDTKFPFVVTRKDTGPHVKVAMIDLPPRSNLLVYSEMASWKEYIKIFEEVTGLKLVYKEVSIEEADRASPWHHIGREVGEVKQFTQELGWHGGDPRMLFHDDVSYLNDLFDEPTIDRASSAGEERDLIEDDEPEGMDGKRGLVGSEGLEKSKCL
ncbi:hypothetical protein GGF50DRAFT_56590 [Schizophyllum commune]